MSEQLSSGQVYASWYFDTCSAFAKSIAILHDKASNATSPAEKASAAQAWLVAIREQDLLANQNDAFMLGSGPINPPSDAQVSKTAKLAQDMANHLWDAKKASDILAGLTNALSDITAYQQSQKKLSTA